MKLTEQSLRKIIAEELALLSEDAGNLKGLPREWIKRLVGYGAGQNSLKKATDVSTGQRNKLVGLLRSAVDGVGVVGVIGYVQGTDDPIFMITNAWEDRSYRLNLTDGAAEIQRYRDYSIGRGRRRSHVYTDTALKAQELVDKIPDGDYTLYTITADPNRKELQQQRKAARGGEYKGGIRKDTLVRAYMQGKEKEIDTLLGSLRSDLQQILNDLFDPDADFNTAKKNADAAVETLRTELTKMSRARDKINYIFNYNDTVSPKGMSSYTKDSIMKVLKEL